MNITVNAKESRHTIKNFWNHLHFHPADAIEDLWGREIIDKISEDKGAQYIRLHAMLEDIVFRDEQCRLSYDFRISDQRLDYLVSKGFKPFLIYDFMPVDIAKDPTLFSTMKRYKGKRFNFSEPADYREWEEVCRTYTVHLMNRYGVEEVSDWYLECWNEPDHSYWLNNERSPSPEQLQEKLEAYCKLYDYFAEGVMSACAALKIGGPAAAGKMPFIEGFIRHCRFGVNHATGEQGSRLDFISFHTYTMGPNHFDNGQFPSVDRLLEKTMLVYDVMKACGCSDTKIVIDEWEGVSRGFDSIDDQKELVYRDNEYFPAHFALVTERFLKAIVDTGLPISMMMVVYSGQHNLVKDFDGYRALFTLNMFPKPIYNIYPMMRKLGSYLLESTIENSSRNVGVIPTRDEQGNIKVLVYQIEENVWKSPGNKKVTLVVNGLDGRYRIRHYRIDRCTSNSFYRWTALGRPVNPTQEERETIKQDGKLSLYYPEEIVDIKCTYSLDIVMTGNCVSLVELEKI